MPRFRQWRQGRPFWGALLTILAGIELYMSGRLQVGGLTLQLGFAGMQTTILPLVLVVLGVLVLFQPVHHLFYGVIALIVSVYCLVAVNLGGFVVGTLLGTVGGIVVVSWMGRKDAAASPGPPPEPHAAAEPVDDDPFLLFDDGPQPDPAVRRSVAAVLSVALAVGGLAGGLQTEGPCILGILLCDLPTTASPSPLVSAEPESTPTPSPAPSNAGDVGGGAGDAIGDAVDGVGDAVGDAVDGVGDVVDGAGDAVDGVGDAVDGALGGAGDEAPSAEQPADPALTVEVPPELPLPADEGLPVVLGGNEDADVYAVPAQLTATDLEIAGVRAVALVSVPVRPGSAQRRNALKLVADHVKVTGFRLRTYAGAEDRTGGTDTTADHVTMDGRATMYITSLTASGPDGSTFTIDADDPPPTLTSLVLAAVRPTVGLLGATSDQQVWTGFHEQVWAA